MQQHVYKFNRLAEKGQSKKEERRKIFADESAKVAVIKGKQYHV